jgi:hypothetical protein
MLFLIVWNLFIHPFHVSVFSVEYENTYQSIRITGRIFLDDLELALRKENKNEELDITKDSIIVHQINERYFLKNLEVTVNGELQTPNYVGGEVEGNVIWVYLEIENIHQLASIKIENTVLTEVYGDQQNILHFKINGAKKSHILTGKEKSASWIR